MYKVFLNDKSLHEANVPHLKVFSPVLELEQNNIDTFSFSIQNTHPYYENIAKMQSIIKVYDDSTLIFYGRVNEDGDDTKKTKKIYCESAEAFLLDSIQEPYEFQGSITDLLTMLIEKHNSQVDTSRQFKVGTVTVTDPNDYITRSDTQYLSTWESIQSKLIDLLGGYIFIRYEQDGMYIDYLADFDVRNNQEIKFGENMLSVSTSSSAKDVFTVLIPLGAENEETGKRLTIEDVNEGKNYVENTEAIAKYGRIWRMQTWDDVTISSNLLTKAIAAVQEGATIVNSIEITALDMASVKKDIRSFKMNAKIRILSDFHNIDAYFLPEKMTINLFKPEENKITLNATHKALTDEDKGLSGIIDTIENIVKDYTVNIPNTIDRLQRELTSLIEQTANMIRTEVGEKYYSKDNNSDLIAEINTVFEQNKEYFEMQFNSFRQDLDNAIQSGNANYEEIRKYIRFVDGNIELGEVNNEFKLIITKERIRFMQGAQEIAYMSNSKMYNTYAQILNSLQIGNFELVPRPNGSLAFKVV